MALKLLDICVLKGMMLKGTVLIIVSRLFNFDCPWFVVCNFARQWIESFIPSWSVMQSSSLTLRVSYLSSLS